MLNVVFFYAEVLFGSLDLYKITYGNDFHNSCGDEVGHLRLSKLKTDLPFIIDAPISSMWSLFPISDAKETDDNGHAHWLDSTRKFLIDICFKQVKSGVAQGYNLAQRHGGL